MKNILLIGLLLGIAPFLSAQCSPDLVPPYLKPKNNTVISLGGPKCTAVVKAEQLLQAYSDNCTAVPDLKLRLRRVGVSSGFPFSPSDMLTLSPADLAAPVFVEVWARDAAGNSSYVYAGITVQNPNTCSFSVLPDTLNAAVGRPDNSGLEEITWIQKTVTPQGNDTTYQIYPWHILPENLFDGPAQDHIITISPEKDNDPLNGVSTYDMVLISQSILGLEPLGNPYKYLAADADRNNRVTEADNVELRKLILGIYTQLPNNASWRFVPDDYIFPMPENPFYEQIPESVTFSRLYPRPLPNFIALKVGDVNFNAVTNSLTEVEDRSLSALELPAIKLNAGQTIWVPVALLDLPSLLGLQCAFGFDPAQLEIINVLAPGLAGFSENNFFQPEPGVLTLSWTDSELKPSELRDPVFFLEIKALQNGWLQEMLHLQPKRLAAEAYPGLGKIANLELVFRALPAPASDKIGLPYPNPATETCYFPVQLAEDGTVIVELFEPDGRQVILLEQHLKAGDHLIQIQRQGLPEGLYFYKISAGHTQLQGRVVLH